MQTRWYIQYEQNTSTGITTVYAQPYIKVKCSEGVGSYIGVLVSTTINGTTKTQSFGAGGSSENLTTIFESSNGYAYSYGSTHTFTIKHGTDGTASCKFSGYMQNTVFGFKKTASHTWSLPTINMASTVSNNTTSSSRIEFGKDVTFTISRPNDTITHTLKYTVDGTEYTIGTGIGESKPYSFPTSLVSKYPSNENVAITVTCTSSNGTSSSTIVYLKVPSTYIPSISLAISNTESISNGWGIYVKGKSKIKGVITASGSGGSTIKSYSASANNQTFNESTFTTSELNTSGTLVVNAKVTDTRERTATTSKSITVYDYATPSYVKVEVIRCNSSGTEDNDGTYGKVVCQYAISPCNNKNTKSLTVTYSGTTKTFTLSNYSGTVTATTSQLFSGLSTTANHTFTFKLIDSFNSSGISQSYVMPPSFVLESKLAGGKGISFGQIATEEGFNVHMNAKFSKVLNALDGLTTSKLKLGRVEYSPKTMSELTANKATSSTSFNTGYSHIFWVNWADYGTYPGYAGMSGFYFQGTQSNSGYIIAIPYQANYFLINCNIDGTRWSGWHRYGTNDGVYDGLDATSTTHALSANQGRILNNKINAIPAQKSLQWRTVTTSRTWSSGTVNTYSNVLENAVGIWIGGKPVAANTGLSALFIPMPLITTTETNFLINDEAQWVRVGMYKSGNNLYAVDRGRGKDGYVSHIYVLYYA